MDEGNSSSTNANVHIDDLIDDLTAAGGFNDGTAPFGTEAPTRAEIERELVVLEDSIKTKKWESLQKRKMENDREIAGMVSNVHNLYSKYGLGGTSVGSKK